jgi:hypothetical protein
MQVFYEIIPMGTGTHPFADFYVHLGSQRLSSVYHKKRFQEQNQSFQDAMMSYKITGQDEQSLKKQA